MLNFRQSQMKSLEDALEKRYHRDLLAWFRSEHCSATAALNDLQLLARIEAGVNGAQANGVVSSEAVLLYVCIAVLVSPEFDRLSQVSAFYLTPGLDADYKTHLLFDLLVVDLDAAK